MDFTRTEEPYAQEREISHMSIEKDTHRITFLVASDVDNMERVFRGCSDFLNQFGCSEFPHFRVVLRELLMNAIKHGNNHDMDKSIEVRLEHVEENEFCLSIEDEGEGFNPTTINLTLPDNPSQMMHRGYVLVNSFAKRIEFNEKGNRVSAYLTIPRDETEIGRGSCEEHRP